jgi:hypothetical protein
MPGGLGPVTARHKGPQASGLSYLLTIYALLG